MRRFGALYEATRRGRKRFQSMGCDYRKERNMLYAERVGQYGEQL